MSEFFAGIAAAVVIALMGFLLFDLGSTDFRGTIEGRCTVEGYFFIKGQRFDCQPVKG